MYLNSSLLSVYLVMELAELKPKKREKTLHLNDIPCIPTSFLSASSFTMYIHLSPPICLAVCTCSIHPSFPSASPPISTLEETWIPSAQGSVLIASHIKSATSMPLTNSDKSHRLLIVIWKKYTDKYSLFLKDCIQDTSEYSTVCLHQNHTSGATIDIFGWGLRFIFFKLFVTKYLTTGFKTKTISGYSECPDENVENN